MNHFRICDLNEKSLISYNAVNLTSAEPDTSINEMQQHLIVIANTARCVYVYNVLLSEP